MRGVAWSVGAETAQPLLGIFVTGIDFQSLAEICARGRVVAHFLIGRASGHAEVCVLGRKPDGNIKFLNGARELALVRVRKTPVVER